MAWLFNNGGQTLAPEREHRKNHSKRRGKKPSRERLCAPPRLPQRGWPELQRSALDKKHPRGGQHAHMTLQRKRVLPALNTQSYRPNGPTG